MSEVKTHYKEGPVSIVQVVGDEEHGDFTPSVNIHKVRAVFVEQPHRVAGSFARTIRIVFETRDGDGEEFEVTMFGPDADAIKFKQGGCTQSVKAQVRIKRENEK